jgi:hypothetical protein
VWRTLKWQCLLPGIPSKTDADYLETAQSVGKMLGKCEGCTSSALAIIIL